MVRGGVPTSAVLIVAVLATSASLLPTASPAAAPEFTLDEPWIVQVDGIQIPDAAVFRSRRGVLIEIPSQPTRFFVDSKLSVAFAVRPEQIGGSGAARTLLREQFAWSVPVSREKENLRFHTGTSEIHVARPEPDPAGESGGGAGAASAGGGTPEATTPELRKGTAPAPPTAELIATPVVPFVPDPAPACGDPMIDPAPTSMPGVAARDCLSLETRPAAGVPGCTRFVFIRNRCETPVVAQVQRIERLMTGTLPQAFNITVRGEEWLGCAWWSGAMAPAQHDILGAAFIESRSRRAAGAPARGR